MRPYVENAAIVTGRVAYLLSRHFDLKELRLTAQTRRDSEVYDTLTAIHEAALRYQSACYADGTSVDPDAEQAAPSQGELLSASSVARLHDVTPHAVRIAVRRGRLRGEQREGRWWFTPEAVADWAATRQAS